MKESHTMTETPFLIAVDGPSASGKGTIARRLAQHYDFAYLDTGLLYRAVGLGVLRTGGDPADAATALKSAQSLDLSTFSEISQDPALRDEASGRAASLVGAVQSVRDELLDFQRRFCATPPGGKAGAVLDGRDIGTVIAPAAPAKLFITASPEIRAARRWKELHARGENVNEAAVLEDLKARDARDAQRTAAPTRQAADAVLLDTSALTVDEVFAAALALVEAARKKEKGM